MLSFIVKHHTCVLCTLFILKLTNAYINQNYHKQDDFAFYGLYATRRFHILVPFLGKNYHFIPILLLSSIHPSHPSHKGSNMTITDPPYFPPNR